MKATIKLNLDDDVDYNIYDWEERDIDAFRVSRSIFVNINPPIKIWEVDECEELWQDIDCTYLDNVIFKYPHEEEQFKKLITINDIIN